MKLCCIFNYAPAYRESIYRKIDETFDTQFYFADSVIHGKPCDIKKLNYDIFKKVPKKIKNRRIIKWGWKSGIQLLPFKNYDAFIITGGTDWSDVIFMLSCKLMMKPVYVWGHGPKSWNWKNFGIDRLLVKLCTKYFTYGEGGRKRLIELGKPETKTDVIYNSLCGHINPDDLKKCYSDEVRVHFGNDFPTLIFVGRLTKVKKLDWLLDAITKHDSEGLKYNLLIIGDGAEGVHLKEKAVQTELSNRIWFYGECYDDNKLNTLIYNSDLCVSPGNVGLTALHSMMFGTPVLSHNDFTTQMPEYETIVEGATGTLYKVGDFEDFCTKIANWLQHDMDREQIRQNCVNMINDKWNSDYQIEILKSNLN